jgi:hypothetical protein
VSTPTIQLSSYGAPIAENHPEFGPLLAASENIHFVAGPWCGVLAPTRMAEQILVQSTVNGRRHWYVRTGRKDGLQYQIAQHARIDDSRRIA